MIEGKGTLNGDNFFLKLNVTLYTFLQEFAKFAYLDGNQGG
jgi:hypothetical protein